MHAAAALPHELRLFLVASAAAAASYLLLTSLAFTPAPPSTPVIRPVQTPGVVHIRSIRPAGTVVHSRAQR